MIRMSFLMGLIACLAGAPSARAQSDEPGLQVAAGLRFWDVRWTSFSYNAQGEILQVPGGSDRVVIPVVRVSYGNFVASASSLRSADFVNSSATRTTRSESDVALGYNVSPNLALTVGYKKMEQRSDLAYRLSGPLLGVNVTAGLPRSMALYGNFNTSVGGFRTPKRDQIRFDARYRVMELGLAYFVPVDRIIKTATLTAGYRIQVLNSLNANTFGQPAQDGQDTTHGFIFGASASF